jgi:NAD(P)H-hydrate epimerase
MIIHSSLTSKDFDQAAVVQYGISTIHLMEIAGKVCADQIEIDLKDSHKKALIICGPGNNGGDGFVVARFLISYGWNVSIILLKPIESYVGSALENLKIVDQMTKDLTLGLQITQIKTVDTFITLIQEMEPDVLIDAMFGVGLIRSIQGLEADLIKTVNASLISVYSIDIPSGISADTGQILGIAIRASKTITFENLKFGHLLFPGRQFCGETIVKEIGLPVKLRNKFSKGITFLTPNDLKLIIKERPSQSHKGIFGKAYIFGGSKHYQGAFNLALNACLKSGAGLVYGIYKDSLSQLFSSRIPPEVIHDTIDSNPIGEIDQEKLIEYIGSLSTTKTALGIGPGLGRDTDVAIAIKTICREWQGKLVIDADGLYAIKTIVDNFSNSSQIIMTPHLAEMSYLTGLSIETIESDLVAIAVEYSKIWNCTLVLKSSSTVISDPSGKVFVNQFGNSGMAKGGTGDVLTGIITSFLAQGYSTWDSSVLGVCIHSLAGDRAAKLKSMESMLPSDICDCIYLVFQEIIK